jgi:integrase
MSALKMEKTRTPGVFRRGSRYVVTFRDAQGRQRKESFDTLREAEKAKAARTTAVHEGAYQAANRITLAAYAATWIDSYRGKGGRGIRSNTIDDYRRYLSQYVLAYFGPRVKLTEIQPHSIAKLVRWLNDPDAQGKARADRLAATRQEARREGKRVSSTPIKAEPVQLSPATIARIVAPLRSLLRTATTEGLLRTNPALGIELPGAPDRPDAEHVEGEDPDDSDVKTFTREQLRIVLAVVHPRHRVLFELLSATGLRISEATALEWRHLALDGDRPHVKVRRAIVRGQVGAPKSKYGRRDVRLPNDFVSTLRKRKTEREGKPGDLVFASERGTVLDPNNLRSRVLRPAVEEAGAGSLAFHAFRHTFASRQLAAGCNIVALSRALGHHSAAFTLAVYGHLLEGNELAPIPPCDPIEADDADRVVAVV